MRRGGKVGFILRSRTESFGVDHRELIHRLCSVVRNTTPFRSRLAYFLLDHLGCGIVTGEVLSGLDNLAEPNVPPSINVSSSP